MSATLARTGRAFVVRLSGAACLAAALAAGVPTADAAGGSSNRRPEVERTEIPRPEPGPGLTPLKPPPAIERDYRDFCRDRPGACSRGYQQGRDPYQDDRIQRNLDAQRQRELESMRRNQGQ